LKPFGLASPARIYMPLKRLFYVDGATIVLFADTPAGLGGDVMLLVREFN